MLGESHSLFGEEIAESLEEVKSNKASIGGLHIYLANTSLTKAHADEIIEAYKHNTLARHLFLSLTESSQHIDYLVDGLKENYSLTDLRIRYVFHQELFPEDNSGKSLRDLKVKNFDTRADCINKRNRFILIRAEKLIKQAANSLFCTIAEGNIEECKDVFENTQIQYKFSSHFLERELLTFVSDNECGRGHSALSLAAYFERRDLVEYLLSKHQALQIEVYGVLFTEINLSYNEYSTEIIMSIGADYKKKEAQESHKINEEFNSQFRRHKSHFDSSQYYDRDFWAVTLVCATGNNHAQIVVQGIDASSHQPFCMYAHFIGPYSSETISGVSGSQFCFSKYGAVKKFKSLNLEKFTYDGAQTWVRPAADVEEMMKSIDTEEKGVKREFSILGRYSIVNSGKTKDSCFTWSKEKLEIAHIYLPGNYDHVIFSSTREITNPTDENLPSPVGKFLTPKGIKQLNFFSSLVFSEKKIKKEERGFLPIEEDEKEFPKLTCKSDAKNELEPLCIA